MENLEKIFQQNCDQISNIRSNCRGSRTLFYKKLRNKILFGSLISYYWKRCEEALTMLKAQLTFYFHLLFHLFIIHGRACINEFCFDYISIKSLFPMTFRLIELKVIRFPLKRCSMSETNLYTVRYQSEKIIMHYFWVYPGFTNKTDTVKNCLT